ncbi:tankyrase-2-like isoform X2 [Mizuhopecten yessoensis]|uniref:tankyrase-2-like isoform X2 n=1 Tax=Mizuhopecten yessoensis TaxID=6573 RepID=UPI000B458C15|nr:tankyrase-2-like isoform X2 [Mizuhopecten yessoensis]
MEGMNKQILFAIKKNDVERVLQVAVMPGCDVNFVSARKLTPLLYACKQGGVSTLLIEKLVAYGADIEYKDKEEKTPFFHACAKGSRELIRTLVRVGCNKNKPNIHGDRPIHEAVIHGNLEALLELLDQGVSINEGNRITGHTPLHLAVLHEQTDVVDLLLQKGAPPDKRGNNYILNGPLLIMFDCIFERFTYYYSYIGGRDCPTLCRTDIIASYYQTTG